MSVPRTIEECDRELAQYRKALTLTSQAGQVAVWEQLDRVLEIRFLLARPRPARSAKGHQYDSQGREAT